MFIISDIRITEILADVRLNNQSVDLKNLPSLINSLIFNELFFIHPINKKTIVNDKDMIIKMVWKKLIHIICLKLDIYV